MNTTFDLVITVTDRDNATSAPEAGMASGEGGSGSMAAVLPQD